MKFSVHRSPETYVNVVMLIYDTFDKITRDGRTTLNRTRIKHVTICYHADEFGFSLVQCFQSFEFGSSPITTRNSTG